MQTKMWLKLTDSDDLISFEKETAHLYKVRIEARLVKGFWQIFKTYYNAKEVAFVEEYTTETKPEAVSVINALKRERDLAPAEIKQIKKLLQKIAELEEGLEGVKKIAEGANKSKVS